MWHTISNSNRTTYNIVFCLLHWVFIKLLQLIYLIKNKFNSPVQQTCSDRSAMTQQHTLQHRSRYVTNLNLPTEHRSRYVTNLNLPTEQFVICRASEQARTYSTSAEAIVYQDNVDVALVCRTPLTGLSVLI